MLGAMVQREGVEATNAHLSANWTTSMARLSQRISQCDPKALTLGVTLYRTTNGEAAQSHGESLRVANGKCPALVLPLLAKAEVASVCALPDEVSDHEFEKASRRRVAALKARKALAATEVGLACISAYEQALRRAKLGPWQGNQDSKSFGR